jgi:uncharacterized protein YjbI with pentapeptide repeats
MENGYTAQEILNRYQSGERYFSDVEMENESFEGANLEGVSFERCFLYSNFRGAKLRSAKFINGNVKTCDFRDADLTNAHFENVSIESAAFKGANVEGVYFNHNWAYGQEVNQKEFEEFIQFLE